MPRKLGPGIKPRAVDARKYETALRRTILDPYVKNLNERLEGARAAWETIAAELAYHPPPPAGLVGTSEDIAALNLQRMAEFHRARFVKQMRRYFGVSINFLSDVQIGPWMAERIQENVDLIKTITQRYHEGLKLDILKVQTETPFDQQKLREILRDRYQSSGYNLRRLTRDQTNKTIGQLSRIRQQQVGIEEYLWVGAMDERERQSHKDNEAESFSWNDPPSTGHPGEEIQCRCFARPIIEFAIAA